MSMVIRNTVKKYYSNIRTFSKSCVRKETEKKLPQSQTPASNDSHMPPANLRLVESKDRYWLLYGSKKYKTKEEIPKYVPVTELAAAQSRVRIKVCNYMMIGFAILFLGVALRAKAIRKEDETISVTSWQLAKLKQWEEEGIKERAAAAAAKAASSPSQ